MKSLNLIRTVLVLASCFYCCSFFLQAKQDPGQLATVNQLQGLYIFTDCRPVNQFQYLGSVKNGFRMAGSSQYTAVRDRLIKKVKADYPAANAIIFHLNDKSADFADAITLKF